ncbi:helix-turn-helix domain-containing protein [Actinoplanes auranticolor]|uniref:Transcriptional regulator n=1 Tax=Actinoplanes auranticolor TaxID=47988 RepID=A0A919STW6_9ACTN|nr:helix-turn-helix domain-containing protein [Actinoplanes auranticolor]GIM76988.1 transcriptional regulator [Actinoplanes auranticolor]
MERELGGFSLDTAVTGAGQPMWEAFTRGWRREIGERFPLPRFTAGTGAAMSGQVSAGRLFDVALTDLTVASPMRTSTVTAGQAAGERLVRLYVVQRGAWVLDDPLGRGEHPLRSGDFLLQHVTGQAAFRSLPHTSARILMFPADVLAPLLGRGARAGHGDSPELRLLMSHAQLVHAGLAALSPAGALAAHAALMELAKGVVARQLDDAEPAFFPALVQAARGLTDARLTDPELTPVDVARRLHVSSRSLQRAFAGTGESLAGYIRRRRLEEARQALVDGRGRTSVAQVAARYQFADSSHFIRTFKRRFGDTPANFLRRRLPVRA